MPTPLSEVAARADEFFMGRSPIHDAMRRIAKALADMNIPFAIAGAMAANAHGHRRETEDVDLLITREGLAAFKERWLGHGWVERVPGLKAVRDTAANVKVDFLITGDFPGDGKPKPVAFPDPRDAAEVKSEGLPVLRLETLIELKLASGMTALHRMQDLADVIQLVRGNKLPADYAERLDPYVREKFSEMWRAAQVEDDY
jgi:hypothetical protein